jgi:carboxyl-terminal processing protease
MLKRSLAGLVVSASLVFLFSFTPDNGRFFDIAKNLDIFATLFKEVNTYYVDEVTPSKLMRSGIDAMLKSLDPYTNYIPEDDIEDFRTMTTGQYGGIGANIGKRADGKTIVQLPYEGYPAQKAGLLAGDEIVEIDDVNIEKKSASEVNKLLRGAANKAVKLDVRRFGTDKLVTLEIIRDRIQIENVPYFGLVTPDIGYLHLSGFTMEASREVRNALMKLKEQGAKKIIFDLRDNPGGLLNEAVNISNLFVPKGNDIVSTKGKLQERNRVYKALDEPIDLETPLVILTSSTSASASEIVAGVMQDYDRAVLIGERTFGKGLVQETRPLSYNSQLKVTTAKYYIPSGRCIQAIDYSHRNDDGSLGKIPDSLRVAFKTANGRVVFDGGGVSPDIEIKEKMLSDIAKTLEAQGYIFDFATRFRAENANIASSKDFRLSDSDYQKFVNFLANKDVSYSTSVEQSVEDLIKKAQDDKHFDDIKTDIEVIKKKISHNKANDLVRFKEEIREMLEQEIASRYYFQKGVIEASFDDDENILAAINVLNNPGKFKGYLKSGASQKGK